MTSAETSEAPNAGLLPDAPDLYRAARWHARGAVHVFTNGDLVTTSWPAALAAARDYYAALPVLPPHALTHCSLHWAAMPYGWARAAASANRLASYQAVVDRNDDGSPIIVYGMNPALNARELNDEHLPNVDYCASVWHRNSRGVAVSISAMTDATPENFGSAPIDTVLVEYMCAAAAALCARYGIDPRRPDACYTHAEAALWDGYFIGDDENARWDLAILSPGRSDPDWLRTQTPRTGDRLRARIWYYTSIIRI